jgi:hypothetical protein
MKGVLIKRKKIRTAWQRPIRLSLILGSNTLFEIAFIAR